MCGIFAIFRSTLSSSELRALALECAKLIRHRGPDWSGLCIQELNDGTNSAIAHERLAIVDPRSGRQPLFNMKGNIAVSVNGEIYNHLELLETKLPSEITEGITSHSDCAVLPLLFETYGTDFVDWLDGKFAFVGSDRTTGRIIAARDPMGLCPLFMGWGRDGSLWFSSEVKCLIQRCISFKEFPPGHFFDSTRTGDKLVRYYRPLWFQLTDPVPTTPLDLVALRTTLERAVHKRFMGDTPFGVLLSGGLDSSIVSAIAARRFQELRRSHEGDEQVWFHRRLQSFAIGLEGSPDLAAARKVASFLGTDHQEFIFTVQEGLDNLRDVIYHLETYDVTTIRAATPLYLLSRMVRSMGLKFVLSGEGADEVFGGYLYFHKAPNGEEFFRETQRKLHDLHFYDVLRTGKAPAAFGLEIRAPFLDREFLDLAMLLNPEEKMCGGGKIEKWPLRKAFEGYLPDEVLWRQKEQFSDGVGYAWIDGLKNYAEKRISDRQMEYASEAYEVNPPTTKEAYLYRTLFKELFPGGDHLVPGGPSIACSTAHVMHWDETFSSRADQSGRAVAGIHNAAF